MCHLASMTSWPNMPDWTCSNKKLHGSKISSSACTNNFAHVLIFIVIKDSYQSRTTSFSHPLCQECTCGTHAFHPLDAEVLFVDDLSDKVHRFGWDTSRVALYTSHLEGIVARPSCYRSHLVPILERMCNVNSSLPWQNGRHFTEDVFRGIFVNENFCILIKMSLKFVPKGAIDNDPALV